MGFARKWIFPIAWLIIFGVIAAALVKIAFVPDETGAADPAFPTAQITEPLYTVVSGTIKNDVSLTGAVDADEAVPIAATLSGEVREVAVGEGEKVSAGQEILKLRAEVVNSDGTSGTRWEIVKAPVDGVLSSFTALVGMTFSVGDAVGQVAPPGFHVTGSIPPEQLYRLTNKPKDAEVTINGGPAPFTCTKLTITAALAGASASGTDGSAAQGATASPVVRCSVPSELTVFAGLSAKVVIAGGVAENVLVVPITAVEGAAGSGNVYFVLADGTTESRAVTLGLNDGANVEVQEGLVEGDQILEFVPGAPGAVDPADVNCGPYGCGG